MKQILIAVLPAVIMLGAMYLVVYITMWASKQRKRGKRSPLSSDLLRSPGESLRYQIDELTTDINFDVIGSALIPLLVYSVAITQMHFSRVIIGLNVLIFYLAAGLFFLAYQVMKLSKAVARRNDLRLGLDAEMAIGQELNQLMRDGYCVYHDFPADGFNIDHVVVGSNGVFAVETKGRAKPKETNDKKNWSVIYDGQNLQFPNWTEREFLPQARRQAQWFSKWLSSAVGEPVSVKPALAIAGWNIELRKLSDVTIFSGKNPQFFSRVNTGVSLSPEMIQRIVHQIEQRCRDVTPQAYQS